MNLRRETAAYCVELLCAEQVPRLGPGSLSDLRLMRRHQAAFFLAELSMLGKKAARRPIIGRNEQIS